DPVVDHRRELDQTARGLRPHDLERRPDADRRLRLRSRRVRPVEPPLQLRLEDLDAHARVVAELDPRAERVVPPLAHRLPALAAVTEGDVRPALAVRAGTDAADAHDGALDARAQVAVDDPEADGIRGRQARRVELLGRLAAPERAARSEGADRRREKEQSD